MYHHRSNLKMRIHTDAIANHKIIRNPTMSNDMSAAVLRQTLALVKANDGQFTAQHGEILLTIYTNEAEMALLQAASELVERQRVTCVTAAPSGRSFTRVSSHHGSSGGPSSAPPILGFAAKRFELAMKRPIPTTDDELGGDDPSSAPWLSLNMSGFVGSTFDVVVQDETTVVWTFECAPDDDSGDVGVTVSRNKCFGAPVTLTITLLPYNLLHASAASQQVQVSVVLEDEVDVATFVPFYHMSDLMNQNPFVSPNTGKFELKLSVFLTVIDVANGYSAPPASEIPLKRMKSDDGSTSPTGFDDDASALDSELSLLDQPLDDKSGLVDLTMSLNYDSKTATGMVGLKNQGQTSSPCLVALFLDLIHHPFVQARHVT
ncbi:hypothetical protein DYB37_012383 [Aphanomyces astaci]|uniref:Uncharacterized protein n=1 Tax=Aphanomyces astaci TaxID=112090 RepID=A0A418D145_APHAT|nr:hypothetical protein DYB35_011857 [Aphanomyces astaci]RHZ31748.1 hypothetical protein DYB37_012383 [Aphanomyces astaci]